MKKTIAALKNLKPEQAWGLSLIIIGALMFLTAFFGWDLAIARSFFTGAIGGQPGNFNFNPSIADLVKNWGPIPANMLLIAAYLFLVFVLARKPAARLYLIPLLVLVAISVALSIPQLWGVMLAKTPEFTKGAVLLSIVSLLGITALGYVHRADPNVRILLFVVLMHLLIPALSVNGVLKNIAGRPRPMQVEQLGGSAKYQDWYVVNASQAPMYKSFASGHAANAALLLTLFFLSRGFPRRQRVIFVVLTLVWWMFVSLGRMMGGSHFFSDTLASLWLAVFFGGALAKYWLKPGKLAQPVLIRS